MSVSLDQNPKDLVMKKPGKIDISNYEMLKGLGEGAFGKVYLTRHKAQGTYWAFKQLKKNEIIKSHQVDHLKNECFILYSLEHPFIVRMDSFSQDKRYIFIIMEFVSGGELFKYLRRVGKFNKIQAAFYGAQVAMIWEYIHSLNVIYRDLKPENLLIDKTGYLKLADFGFAKIVPTRTYTLCGTPEYLAPEVILNKGHGKAVDWWTLGVLIYEMLVGIDPFNDPDPMAMYQNILKGVLKFPKHVDSDSKSIIKHLLESDLSKRYGNLKNQAQDVKDHRFFDHINWKSLYDRTLQAPYVPPVKAETDTSNFTAVDKIDDRTVPEVPPPDPFSSW